VKRLIIIALATVVALSLVLMPAVGVSAASPKMEVSGTFGLHTFTAYETLEVGPNVILFVEMGADWAGDLQGSDLGYGIEVDRANGRYVLNSISTWEGTIDGKFGTIQITTASRGLYGPDPGPPLWFTGTMTLVGLSGELAGVHGKITFGSPMVLPPDPYPIPYSGWIMF